MDDDTSTQIENDVESNERHQTPNRPVDWDPWCEPPDPDDRLLLEEAGYGHGV